MDETERFNGHSNAIHQGQTQESVRPYTASPWIRPGDPLSQTNLDGNVTKVGVETQPQPPYGVSQMS